MFQTDHKPLQFVESADLRCSQNDPTPVEFEPFRAENVPERVITPHTPQSNTDEFHLFGLTVAEQLRQLPLETALVTEEMILAVIRKQRIKTANRHSHHQTEPEIDDPSVIVKVEEHLWDSSSDTNNAEEIYSAPKLL